MKPASSSLEARLSPKITRATSLHNEKILGYVEVVNTSFMAYAPDDTIAHEVQELDSYKLAPEVSVMLYAKRLYIQALN